MILFFLLELREQSHAETNTKSTNKHPKDKRNEMNGKRLKIEINVPLRLVREF